MCIRRSLTTAVFIAAFFAVLFLYTDTVHADVEIRKDGSTVAQVSTYQDAVEAVNSNSSIKAGDDIKFVIKGDTYPGIAPAFNKRIDLEIVAEAADPSMFVDSIVYGNGQTFNILNVGRVHFFICRDKRNR